MTEAVGETEGNFLYLNQEEIKKRSFERSAFLLSPRADSNRRPFPYQGNAPPTELRGQAKYILT